MSTDFRYDVFLSHSSKDKPIVRDIAKRLKEDGLRVWLDEWEIRPGDSIPAKIEEGLENSRVLVLFMSKHSFGSDWAQLESTTFRFRDPLNKERRFIPLLLDDTPIKGSISQFLYIDWRSKNAAEYQKLIESCGQPQIQSVACEVQFAETTIKLGTLDSGFEYSFGADGKRALTSPDETIQLWDIFTGRCLSVLRGHEEDVLALSLSADQRLALSGSYDTTVRLWDVKTGSCLRVLHGHNSAILSVLLSADKRFALSSSMDNTIRLWDLKRKGRCRRVFRGHGGGVVSLAWTPDPRLILSGSHDKTVRLWDIQTGHCLKVLKGHEEGVIAVSLSTDQRLAISGSHDKTIRLWDVETGRCLRVLEGHKKSIFSVILSENNRLALSGSMDKTIRLWDVETGRCLCVLEGHKESVRAVSWIYDQRHAISGDYSGHIKIWDLSEAIDLANASSPIPYDSACQVQYTNAKVLLVGDTGSGKTGLAHRLATGQWKPSDGSTVGAWSTQWKLNHTGATPGMEREIWLWDFGGQADQRLIHQLWMDRAALILLLFNADHEDVLPGLRDWLTALRRCVPGGTPQLLVAGRIDAGFKASRTKLKRFADEQNMGFHETSAMDGTGCEKLREDIMSGIVWENLPVTSTEYLFKLVKEEILKLRDEGQVLHTFKELRELLRQRLLKEQNLTDEVLSTVLDLLVGPGAVKIFEYGTYILLQPEWINVYA